MQRGLPSDGAGLSWTLPGKEVSTMCTKHFLAALLLLTLAVVQPRPAVAGFKEGVEAWKQSDYATARRELLPLAEQGRYPFAQYILGRMYDLGQGVPQDYFEAVKWYRKAATKGSAFAQTSLGLKYEKGEGVPQDYTEAMKWHRKATVQGLTTAEVNIGRLYLKGLGVLQNYAEAIKWYRKAANKGDGRALTLLGSLHYLGEGMPKDYVRAHAYFNLSVAQGNKDAVKGRDLISKLMTPPDISKAQRLAREWLAAFEKKSGSSRTVSAQRSCAPETPDILCNPPKLDPRYRHAFTGLSGAAFEQMPMGGRWAYISGVWDSYLYRYYFEKDEEFNWLATCFRKHQGNGKINPVEAASEIALGIEFSGNKSRPASEFILAQIRVACVLGFTN